jgi:hypothetical protein
VFETVASIKDAEVQLRLTALEEWIQGQEDEFGPLRQAQESTESAFTVAIVQLLWIESGVDRMP